jgi:hypothetical protein
VISSGLRLTVRIVLAVWDALRDTTHTIYQTLRSGTPTQGQQQRLHQLAPAASWQQALGGGLSAVSPRRPGNSAAHNVIEIAIYPDVVRLAARSLHTRSASHRAAP